MINELFDQPEKVTERLIITVYTEKLTVRRRFSRRSTKFSFSIFSRTFAVNSKHMFEIRIWKVWKNIYKLYTIFIKSRISKWKRKKNIKTTFFNRFLEQQNYRMIYKHKKWAMIQHFYINWINTFSKRIWKRTASKNEIFILKSISMTRKFRYELNCLEEKFQMHLERVESSGGQRRSKLTGLG